MEVNRLAKKQQKKKKGRSVQQLIGIKTFTKHGIRVGKDELLFYAITPTNISVLSATNIEAKIRNMMVLLSAMPDIEVSCTDSSECFDDNKLYLKERLEGERLVNPERNPVPSQDRCDGRHSHHEPKREIWEICP